MSSPIRFILAVRPHRPVGNFDAGDCQALCWPASPGEAALQLPPA